MIHLALSLMATQFVQPRFTGARFNEHTLPLELTKDLLAYQELVRELARHLYLEDHKKRKKLPKKFNPDFQLHIQRVDDGCARPLLSLLTAGALMFADSAEGYLTEARDLISECIYSEGTAIPAAFPRHLLSHFNKIGVSLREDEAMELPTVDERVATLTPERRRRLVSACDTEYRQKVKFKGILDAVSWGTSTFTIRDLDGKLLVAPLPDNFRKIAGEYGDRPRHLIRFDGVGVFSPAGKLTKIESIEALDVQPDYMMAERLEKLAQLEDGWFDGTGKALDGDALSFIAEQMISKYPENIDLPAIIPTQEGNLLLEWTTQGDPSVDINLSTMKAHFHAFGVGETNEIEAEFDLRDRPNWKGFYGFLSQHIVKSKA